MLISTNTEKAFDKIWSHDKKYNIQNYHKNSQQTRSRGELLQLIYSIYKKPTGNIIHGIERLNALLLKSRIGQGCSLSPRLVNIAMEALPSAIRNKKIQNTYKLEVKNWNYLYLQITQLSTQKIPRNWNLQKEKNTDTNKWVQQSYMIQDQHTIINQISIY